MHTRTVTCCVHEENVCKINNIRVFLIRTECLGIMKTLIFAVGAPRTPEAPPPVLVLATRTLPGEDLVLENNKKGKKNKLLAFLVFRMITNC